MNIKTVFFAIVAVFAGAAVATPVAFPGPPGNCVERPICAPNCCSPPNPK
ncbi:hypothetical protein BC829DRAFT_440623 [Chytridium lagenaria]|nr:hypothetical protein BC829DRAFT_440623 [Chytridium lagenaria]